MFDWASFPVPNFATQFVAKTIALSAQYSSIVALAFIMPLLNPSQFCTVNVGKDKRADYRLRRQGS
jgi:hypothetical protein